MVAALNIERHTVVVQGPLGHAMRRAAAARSGESGLQILTPAQLAGRLAGGFCHLATAEVLEPIIRRALAEGGFHEIEHVKSLPGMTRAVARTLRKAWNADLDLQERATRSGPRVADLALIERRIKQALPAATLLPADLREAAIARLSHAANVLGPVRIEGAAFPLSGMAAFIPAALWCRPRGVAGARRSRDAVVCR
jgi:hypothetical protein